MPDDKNSKLIDLNPAHGIFPVAELLECGLWSALSANAKAVLAVLWNFHRQYPDACRPSRKTLAAQAGVCGPSVTKALKELEAVGIVKVTADVGPRTNLYKLQWRGLRAPPPQAKKKDSPFVMPSFDVEPEVAYDEDGQGHLVWSQGAPKGYKMADGCFVRSAKEQHIHDYLIAWNVPHWCDARYIDLGIRVRKPNGDIDRKATVDFVVGPKLLIEQEGLPKAQRGAKRYMEKLKQKEDAVKAAGWEMIRIPPDRRPDDWLHEAISDSWAESTIDEAEALIPKLKKAGLWNEGRKNCLRLMAHISEANKRLTGEKPPKERTRLYTSTLNEHGMSVMVRNKKPAPCLMESAAPASPVPEPTDEPATIEDTTGSLACGVGNFDELDALVDDLLG